VSPKERQDAVDEIKEICQELGCSGLSDNLCQKNPHQCKIIQKILDPKYKRRQCV